MAQFVDVYQKYQGSINWAQVKAAGIQGVWVKGTNGSAAAAVKADAYVKGAKGVGLKVGLYAYVTGAAGPEADAKVLASEMKRLGATSLAPMCDFEDASLPTGAAARQTWVTTFFKTLKAEYPAVTNAYLYLSGSWAASMLPGWWPAGSNHITTGGVNVYLMDAEYGVNNGLEHAPTHYTGAIAAHQFTSVGRVSGIPGSVDRDNVTVALSAIGTATTTPEVPDLELTDSFTYTSRVTGTAVTTNVKTALGKASDLFDQLTKGNGDAGGGPAGYWVNNFLTPDHATLAEVAADVAALKAAAAKSVSPVDPAAVAADLAPTVTAAIQAAFAGANPGTAPTAEAVAQAVVTVLAGYQAVSTVSVAPKAA